MDRRKKFLWAVALGCSVSTIGCQAPSFWQSKTPTYGSASPDVAKQRYESLAGGSGTRGTAQSPAFAANGPSQVASGPVKQDNALTSAWKKSTAAVSSAFALEPGQEAKEDPTSLSSSHKKVTPQVYVAAARMMEGQGKFDDAQKQYDRALQADPKDLNALVGLARLHDRQGRSAKALEFYQKAVKAHPKSALVHNDLGLCYGRMQDWRQSAAEFSKACQMAPENTRYRNNLAMSLLETGDEAGALKQLSLGNSPAIGHYNLAFMLSGKDRQDEASRHLQQAISLDPNLTPAREMLAQLGAAAAEDVAQAQPAAVNQIGPYAMQSPRVAAMPVSTGGSAYSVSPTIARAPQPSPAPATGGGTTFRISDEELTPPQIQLAQPNSAAPAQPATGAWQWQPAPQPAAAGPELLPPTE